MIIAGAPPFGNSKWRKGDRLRERVYAVVPGNILTRIVQI